MHDGHLDDLERLLSAGFRDDSRRAGVTESTGRVLLALRDPDGLPMTDLAARLDRSPSTTTRFVDRAARQGLVSRETGEDRRQRLVRLTPAGLTSRERLQALRRARTEALPHEVRARTGLGTAEVLWLLDALVEAVRGSGTPATGGD